ncbi:MAG: site-specific integrase [Candidatus Methanoplasma sp.]|jgi:integrase/recombinase XerD|nr:site-specific integrase [Candidatus Methanoplasma sp.]
MSRYPYMEFAEEYIALYKLGVGRDTALNAYRRLRRQAAAVNALRDEGLISSSSPAKMTMEDVRVVLSRRKSLGRSAGDYAKEVSIMRGFFEYVGSGALAQCLLRYPQLKPSVGRARHSSFDDAEYAAIMEGAAAAAGSANHSLARAYSAVCLCVCCGCRAKEVRMADVRDLDMDAMEFTVRHPKGEGTYGEERSVPIPIEMRPLFERYLELRAARCAERGVPGSSLFPSLRGGGIVSSQRFNAFKSEVEADVGFRFTLYKCRRDFGQRYVDRGLDIEDVSVLMGHGSTLMTERFYGRKRLTAAKENARRVLSAVADAGEEERFLNGHIRQKVKFEVGPSGLETGRAQTVRRNEK